MRHRCSVPAFVTVGAMLGLCVLLCAVVLAQAGATGDEPSRLIGNWTLNRELSGATPSPDVGVRRGGRRGGGAGVGGGGFGGGRGQSRSGQDPGEARAEAERTVALVQELVTPTTRWLIVRDAGDTLAFTNADGRTVRYTPNNKAEKHQLINGTIETKSRWTRGELRQEIIAVDGFELVRTFALDVSTGQLIVTTTFGDGGSGRQPRPYRVVYDREEG